MLHGALHAVDADATTYSHGPVHAKAWPADVEPHPIASGGACASAGHRFHAIDPYSDSAVPHSGAAAPDAWAVNARRAHRRDIRVDPSARE